jgi:hypothetical protein
MIWGATIIGCKCSEGVGAPGLSLFLGVRGGLQVMEFFGRGLRTNSKNIDNIIFYLISMMGNE